ncbi:MAG: heme-binding domain-containing protein [Flavobacteriaceae bacterium]|nr:heme-binding domain-containing protein [Flavobacteriaceae bacterium]
MKKIILIIIGVLLLIQVIRPEKNNADLTPISGEDALLMTEDIAVILEKACYDCHSNRTNYLWYAEVAPVSWFIAFHVNDGKEHLNFSEWNAYNNFQKEYIIKGLYKEIKGNKMPLKSYTWMHPESLLSATEKEALLTWVKTLKNN